MFHVKQHIPPEMIELFLSEPAWGENSSNNDSHNKRESLLDELELVIWSLMSSGGRSEARLWLCNTLSRIRSISQRRQKDLFLTLLRSKPTKRYLASQLLQLIFEKQPQYVGPIIAKKSHKLETFFKGNPRRILLWFSNFSGTSELEHSHGAKALSQYAFLNRDICWEELEWKGKHGQSPAMVATKPHYFLDLDVQRTVENFLEYVPEFWSSNEFSDSLKDGSILSIDTQFFVNLFIDLMYKEDREEVWDIIEDFLMEQSFSFLSLHLLIILEEKDFRLFLDLMPKYLKQRPETVVPGDKYQLFEIILANYSDYSTIDELLLLNAVTNQGRQLLRLVLEEGSDEEKKKIKNFVSQLCESSSCINDLAPLIDCSENKPFKLIKRLGVQSWVILFKLSEELRSPESWESLFTSNGIKFRKTNKYALLLDDDLSEDYGSDSGGRSSKSRKAKKRKKHRKKRRQNFDIAESYEDESDDFNSVNNRQGLQQAPSDWLLSTDGYSTTWSTADLPEHLSDHCFQTWLKWVFAKWRLVD